MQYGHIYAAICIIIKLKVMFWKLYTRIDFNVGTFNPFYLELGFEVVSRWRDSQLQMSEN